VTGVVAHAAPWSSVSPLAGVQVIAVFCEIVGALPVPERRSPTVTTIALPDLLMLPSNVRSLLPA
jgi:hypothetical protein